MPRFNSPASTVSRTTNLAGGQAFSESPELELASIVLTSMLNDQAYRSGGAGMARVVELLAAVDPMFAAQCAVYARNEYGMRSISHVVAGELGMRVKGERWTRPFFNAVVRRPDDITEILSYVITKHGKRPIPNAMKDGLARSFGKFDAYQIAKYRGDGHAMGLVDAVNLVHPKPTEQNAEALKALVAGTLRLDTGDTWEAALSAAGDSEDAEDAKDQAWATLIAEKRIGYFALLRNLRNIMQQSPESVAGACALLTDEALIRKSLVLPFRFATAAAQLTALPGARQVLEALSHAAEIALANVPRFDGRTLIVVDDSGSMVQAKVGRGQTTTVADAASLFAAVLYKRNDADLMLFDADARYANVPPDSGMLGLSNGIRTAMRGGGTNFAAIFPAITQAYDRVIILSDMQGWMSLGYGTGATTLPTGAFEEYVQRVGKRPHVYSFDIAGMGTLQFPQAQVYCLAGFSDRVFEVMATLEQDKQALVNRIKAVTFA